MKLRKTKIICTIGPASENRETVRKLFEAGMNVARFNFSHGTREEHGERMNTVRSVAAELGRPVGLLLDTKGPEIRTGTVKGGGRLLLTTGERVTLVFDGRECVPGIISLSYEALPREAAKGNHIFIADGLIDLLVEEVSGGEILCAVLSGGEIGSRKNVNVTGVKTSLPALGDEDYRDLAFGIKRGIDFVAASFIRKAQDVVAVKRAVSEAEVKPLVIAKIEDEEGVENIDDILRVADGILIARGDLGVQLPGEEIPLIQKRIIEKCNAANKIAVTATQMLESMTVNPKPTRAELTDVANAVFDGTDAVMLSGETAGGRYPVEAAEVMNRIIRAVEASPEYHERLEKSFRLKARTLDIPHAVAKAGYVMASEIGAASILAPTKTGNTARVLSMYRPEQIILAATPDEKVCSRLLLSWGVYPFVTPETKDSDEMIMDGLKEAMKSGYAKKLDRVVVVAGVPVGSPLLTNMVRVYFLGNILCRGERGYGGETTGRVVNARDAVEASAKLMLTGDEILVTGNLEAAFLPLLRNIAGYVLEGYSDLTWEEIRKENPDIVVVASAAGARDRLTDNMVVTLSGQEKLVYEGII